MECPVYKGERKAVWARIKSMCPQFGNLKENQKFKFLLTGEGVYGKGVADLCANIMKGGRMG